MLYQFMPDWSGLVLAERVRHSPGTYLSLRFPATDIPAIARKLYAQTPYRHIPDVIATPVPILAQHGEGTALDLTWSDLRSVSPMHVEYLSNMNVVSSFSTSVMVEGKLWGLVACHHPEPRRIPLEARLRCKALVDAYVEALLSHRRSIERHLLETLSTQLEPVRVQLARGVSIADSLASQFEVLSKLFGVTSGAVAIGDQITPLGVDAPPAEMLTPLHQWCSRAMSDTLYATDHLAGAWDATPEQTPVCGLLCLSVRAKQIASGLLYLYLFRPEEVSEVAWAGNPEKPMEASGDGVQISPRKSFERWVQVRRGFSRTWSDEQMFVARQLRDQLSTWL
jgi:light-regulated signal transduction histidine kinase (bacteriophytochrome)